MVQVPDEFLMAYADGQVSLEERTWFEGILATDPELRVRLEPFLATGPSQWAAFDSVMQAPIPDRLIQAIRSGGQAAPSAAPRSAVPQSRSKAAKPGLFERLFPNGFGLTPALGYAAALAMGVGIGTSMLSPQTSTDDSLLKADRDGFVATGRLQVALDRSPSNGKNLVREGDIRPVLSLRDRDGRICRQYEIVARQKGPQGLACREPNGEWRITVMTGGAETGGVARPASQDDQGGALDGMVGEAVKRLPGHNELTAPEELYLIENGWARGPAN
jgi:hypothetical protein